MNWFAVGALAAGLGVGLGAFGAHGLKQHVDAPLLQVFETGVRYHMYHALALLGVGWAATQTRSALVPAAGLLFLCGIVIFSGSLYALTLTGARWLGALTPFGGLAFLAGWVCLALAAWRAPGGGP